MVVSFEFSLFIISGAAAQITDLLNFGVLTFGYGIWAWMVGEAFHIDGNFNYPAGSKWPGIILWGAILAQILPFFLYAFLRYKIFL